MRKGEEGADFRKALFRTRVYRGEFGQSCLMNKANLPFGSASVAHYSALLLLPQLLLMLLLLVHRCKLISPGPELNLKYKADCSCMRGKARV